jgi:hypothetical protein
LPAGLGRSDRRGRHRSRGRAWGKLFQDFPVGQHVGDAAGDAQIVFEHGEAAIGKADEIGAADADVDSARDVETAHLAAEVAASVDQFFGDDSVRQDSSVVVDVFEKQVQGGDALGETALDLAPFGVGNDAGRRSLGKTRSVPSELP